MTQTLVLNILVLALVVALFASIHRLRSSSRLRLWILGWIFVLLHFGILLWRPALLPLAEIADAAATSALLLCGISFLLSASVLSSHTRRVQVAIALSIPSVAFVCLSSFAVASPMVYLVLDLTGHAIALILLWYFYRDALPVAILGTALVTGCSHWILYEILLGHPETGVELILMELFAMHALVFWQDHGRKSAGVATTAAGLLCWAAVFPLSLAMQARFPHVYVNDELWNVPKFLVAFGMVVTLLEEEVGLASRQFAQYQMLFEQNPLPMWIAENGTRAMLEVNAAAVAEYGYTRDEFLSMSMDDLLVDAAGARSDALPRAADTRRPGEAPWKLARQNGSASLVEITAHSVLFEGREAQLVLAQDVTERVRMHEQLIHQANHDPLTGLPNRLLLQDRLKGALASASRHGSKAAVLCLDLDRFKQINDTFGHAAGDGCLKEIAARLKQRLRTVDTAARVGGEEFMVILDEIKSVADAERVAEDLLFALSAPHVVDGRRIQLSASVGIAIYPDDAREPADLWRMSDTAMYQAKQAGGNRHRLFSRLSERLAEREG